MTDSVDPRIQARRHEVQANRFRGSVRRALWLLAMITFGALVVWAVQSSPVSIQEIVVEGATYTPVDDLLADHDIVLGQPLLTSPAAGAERAFRDNPWVVDVSVSKVFPNTIEVIVVERDPVAILNHRSGDAVVAADGVVVEIGDGLANQTKGIIRASASPVALGQFVSNPFDTAAIEFLDAWQGSAVVVSVSGGELWALVDGFDVRLGGVTDMPAKARSLAAVLAEGQPPGALINVMAPTRPTVTAAPEQQSQPIVEG